MQKLGGRGWGEVESMMGSKDAEIWGYMGWIGVEMQTKIGANMGPRMGSRHAKQEETWSQRKAN